MKKLILPCALCLLLTACGGAVTESNESAIANQAESLERAANATTDQMIREIEASGKAEQNRAGSGSAPAAKSNKR